MARCYSVVTTGQSNTGTTYPLLGIVGSAAIRPMIYDVMVGSKAAPADYACGYDIARSTGASTGGTTPTPSPLIPTDPASTTTGVAGATGGSTKSTVLLSFSVNQRATFRWVASPGSELVCTLGANCGLNIFSNGASTAFNADMALLFQE